HLAAACIDVAPYIQRARVGDGAGDADRGEVDVVAPDAHVRVAAFGLDAVVPGVRDAVAVDVGVRVRESGGGEIVLAADAVVEVVAVLAVDLVPADHVVAAAIAERDRLRTGGMAPRPAVRAVARMMDAVSLHDQPLELPGLVARGAHAGLHV